MLFRKLAISFLLVLLATVPCNSTSIVIIIIGDIIFAGCDGKLTKISESGKISSTQLSKIEKVNGYYFAFSGFLGIGESYNIKKVVKQNFNPTYIDESIRLIQKNVKDSLEKWIPEMKVNYPLSFKKLQEINDGWFAVSVFGYKNNKAFFNSLEFGKNSKDIDKCTVKNTVHQNSGNVIFYYMGQQAAMRKFVADLNKSESDMMNWLRNPPALIEKLIYLETIEKPDLVDYPITFLELIPGRIEKWQKFPGPYKGQ